ncbi:hypothetical protein DFH29DRAFT_879353 [Suillus ampliporus]|nr:hypothetical protein DFH29DRAFT_879353 [Suillus ampliporus]
MIDYHAIKCLLDQLFGADAKSLSTHTFTDLVLSQVDAGPRSRLIERRVLAYTSLLPRRRKRWLSLAIVQQQSGKGSKRQKSQNPNGATNKRSADGVYPFHSELSEDEAIRKSRDAESFELDTAGRLIFNACASSTIQKIDKTTRGCV